MKEIKQNLSYLSAFLVIASFILISLNKFNYGVEFSGGIAIQLTNNNNVAKSEISKVFSKIFKTNPKIESRNDASLTVKIPTSNTNTSEKINELKDTLKKMNINILQIDNVGAQITKTLISNSITGCFFALIMITIYMLIRFNHIFAIAGMLCLLHDFILTAAFVSLFQIELNLTIISAFLTILGYCINDKIIVFDRIRSNLLSQNLSISEIINMSIKSVITRSILTSLTTIIGATCLLFFNDQNIHDFAKCVIFGIIIGTYSSIVISGTILQFLKIKKIEPKNTKDPMFYAS